jgi:hypothetical protein
MLSAGGFAEFHTQMNVYDVLEPIYGDLGQPKNQERMLQEWLQSKAFQVSGLEASEVTDKIHRDCRSTSDFLRIVMEEVARKQGVERWIDSTPTNVPHILRIQRDFPDARFVHIIRDARDVALSLDKRGWSRPLPWEKGNGLLAAGLYWEWIVRKGRRYGPMMGDHYQEVRYEDLVLRPAEELAKLGAFLQCDLDYERIQRNRIGSVNKPLTSFKEDLQQGTFSPVGRWKEKFPPGQLVQFEALVGDYLRELGYQPSTDSQARNHSLIVRKTRLEYWVFYECKQWAKIHTPLSRMMVNYSEILIDK